MAYPPSKRLRGFHNENPVDLDSFGDDEDFTQDDLEEIDIIASQAITRDAQPTHSKRTFDSISAHPAEQSKAPVREGRKTFALGNSHSNSSSSSSNSMHNNTSSKRHEACGNGPDRDELYYSRLEAQQAELKKKLKEVEEQILMKNGEIRVLRDSLRQANQEKEQERQAHLDLERKEAHVQSEKEKELAKKVESLQSELHFKEAEMNEMKSKLQSSERGARLVGTPVRNSTNSPAGRVFVTKEAFAAELPVRPSSAKGKTEGGKRPQPESGSSDPASDSDRHPKGPVLLNLLLQQRLEPSSLGLCHLLCVSPDALPAVFPRSGCSSATSSVGSSTSSTDFRPLHQPPSNFYQHQSLAMSALAMLAHSAPTRLSQRSCQAAVHFLPLLQYHIGLYCQTLEAISSSGKSPLRTSALSGSSDRSGASAVAESLSAHEELALAAMRALYHVVNESSEAVTAALSGQEEKDSEKTGNAYCAQKHGQTAGEKMTAEELTSQNPLLKRLAQLADLKFVSNANRRESVVNSSLRTLCALAERATERRLLRLQTVLTTHGVVQNLSLESACSTVFHCVRFLAFMVDSEDVASKLCSHKYVCPFVQLFQYVTARSDKSVTDETWSRLEIETVRLLTKLFTQRTSTWVSLNNESSCPCSSQVVKTVVMVLHRQWLSIKGQEKNVSRDQTWTGPGVRSLRDTLMFLHWLLMNDSSFSVHCLDVLHMYHQIIPAIRDTLRRIPDLSESEELAIEEMCRPEAEDVEDMDIDAAS